MVRNKVLKTRFTVSILKMTSKRDAYLPILYTCMLGTHQHYVSLAPKVPCHYTSKAISTVQTISST